MNSKKLMKRFFNKLLIILVQSEFQSWLVMISKTTGLFTSNVAFDINHIFETLYALSYIIMIVGQQKYSWGVFNGACSKKAKDANHGVLIAGYTKSKLIFMIHKC